MSKKLGNTLEYKRCIAIKMLMTGCSREEVMGFFDIKWGTLQEWVRLWNKGGREALRVGKPTGCPPKLTDEAKDFIVRKIEFTNPKTGERITGTAISGQLKKIFWIDFSASSVYRTLHQMGYRRIRPRKIHRHPPSGIRSFHTISIDPRCILHFFQNTQFNPVPPVSKLPLSPLSKVSPSPQFYVPILPVPTPVIPLQRRCSGLRSRSTGFRRGLTPGRTLRDRGP